MWSSYRCCVRCLPTISPCAPVADFHAATEHEQVLRLDVAVQDAHALPPDEGVAGRIEVIDSARSLPHEFDPLVVECQAHHRGTASL